MNELEHVPRYRELVERAYDCPYLYALLSQMRCGASFESAAADVLLALSQALAETQKHAGDLVANGPPPIVILRDPTEAA